MTPRFASILLVLIFLLAACRRDPGVQGPLIQATLTPTPRSTPLPPVPTIIPPGTEDNPITMVIRPPLSGVARELITDFQVGQFEETLQEVSGLVIEVTVVDRYAEALAALCDSTPTQVSVVWLDGLGYAAAVARDCGTPVIQVERNDQTGDPGELITSREDGVQTISDIQDSTMCRLGFEDTYSWLVPALMFRASGIDPDSDLEAIEDYPDLEALVGAADSGDCAAIGMAASDFEALDGSVRSNFQLLETTPPFPFAVLMYPASLPLGERLRLDEALLNMAIDPDAADKMEPLLGQDNLVRATPEDFDLLSDFLESTGLDFALLGN